MIDTDGSLTSHHNILIESTYHNQFRHGSLKYSVDNSGHC